MKYDISHPDFLKEQVSEQPDGSIIIKHGDNTYMIVGPERDLDGTIKKQGPYSMGTLISLMGLGVLGAARKATTTGPIGIIGGLAAAQPAAAAQRVETEDALAKAHMSTGTSELRARALASMSGFKL